MSMDSSDPFAAATIRAQRINYAFIAACMPGIMTYQEAVSTFVSTTISCLDDGVSIGKKTAIGSLSISLSLSLSLCVYVCALCMCVCVCVCALVVFYAVRQAHSGFLCR